MNSEYFGLNSFSMSDVSLGIASVVLEVLIATSPPPPSPTSQGNSRLPITRTLANSNLALTRTKIDFPWISVIHSL